jgi:hypothetical protein
LRAYAWDAGIIDLCLDNVEKEVYPNLNPNPSDNSPMKGAEKEADESFLSQS